MLLHRLLGFYGLLLQALALHMEEVLQEGLGLGFPGCIGPCRDAERALYSSLKLYVIVLKVSNESRHKSAGITPIKTS